MLKIKIITQGRIKEKWLSAALSEYEKRLTGKIHIEWILCENDQELEEKILETPHCILLDPLGKSMTSETFSQKLFTIWGRKTTFAIGGSIGFSKKLLSQIENKVSLSLFTFTHQIVRLILVEQIYRAYTIHEGIAYHK